MSILSNIPVFLSMILLSLLFSLLVPSFALIDFIIVMMILGLLSPRLVPVFFRSANSPLYFFSSQYTIRTEYE
jgi:hypothetical protein